MAKTKEIKVAENMGQAITLIGQEYEKLFQIVNYIRAAYSDDMNGKKMGIEFYEKTTKKLYEMTQTLI